MNLISKISKMILPKSFDERLKEVTDLEKSIKKSKEVLNTLALEYSKESTAYKNREVLCSGSPTGIKKAESRYNNFLRDYDNRLAKAIKEDLSLDKKYSNLLKSQEILFARKYVEEQRSTVKSIKKALEKGLINVDEYLKIREKHYPGKVKYSDTIVLNENNEILLVKRSPWDDDYDGAWVIPGGHVDPGEDHFEAGLRELVEESGLIPEDKSYFPAGSYTDNKCHIEYYIAYFEKDEANVVLDFHETIEYKWLPIHELDQVKMVFNMNENIQKILGARILSLSFLENTPSLPTEVVEKARSGVYLYTPENIKLGRAGKRYGDIKVKKKDTAKYLKDTVAALNPLIKESGLDLKIQETTAAKTTSSFYITLLRNFDPSGIRFKLYKFRVADHPGSKERKKDKAYDYRDISYSKNPKDIAKDIVDIVKSDEPSDLSIIEKATSYGLLSKEELDTLNGKASEKTEDPEIQEKETTLKSFISSIPKENLGFYKFAPDEVIAKAIREEIKTRNENEKKPNVNEV